MTVTGVRSVHVSTVGVVATVLRLVLTFVNILVTVWSSPATVDGATRRTTDHVIARFTATEILAVLTPTISGTH